MPSVLHGHVHRRSSLNSNRSSTDEARPDTATGEDDTTVVEPDQGNVLSHIISQLRPGADLSRVTLPTFILEPRSMLERITNFMAHPDTLLPMPTVDDPVQRFVSVVKFYLSGWHIKPPGVKKPLNPILGETFTCFWDYPDNTKGYYISEQTSHHPPKSSYFFMAPEHGIRVDGTLKPRSKFLGNSAASLMEGISFLRFLNRGTEKGGEKYILTQPNMYARGILFGKMKYELGDHSYVRCPETNLTADIEFKTKGYFSGTYNAIGGVIKNEKTGESLYELSGLWTGEMYIKDVVTGHKELLFNATHAKHAPPLTRPMAEMNERESQKLWLDTVQAINAVDHQKATDEKSKIEDRQREEAAKRADEGVEWRPSLFRRVEGGPDGADDGEEDLDWIINAKIDTKDPKKITEQILNIAAILPGQKPKNQFQIPPHSPSLAKSTTKEPTQAMAPSLAQPSDNLVDFDDDKPVKPAPAPTPAQASNKASIPAMGLMDDDAHMGDMNQKMGSMKVMEPTQATTSPLTRTDTETSEVDTFFDAQ